MATIKAIDASTIHRIQSGQVIVDLCSVAKELIENSVDASATSLELRFKNQGLDSIEVQDNGSGISPENYAGVGLKHHTSKLSTYEDISNLQTFGFRGEAISSLCALSHVTVITCRDQDVPKGAKLKFNSQGVLEDTSVVAAQRGTMVIVENLFYNLPVRRKELERNIKREWNKLIALLNQYACIQTNLKFTVSQQPTKGKKVVLFSTKGNANTRENIINVFGAKTMQALVSLDLTLELKPTTSSLIAGTPGKTSTNEVHIVGYVSRPAHGEGRQTPDRQMFYVNGRPCGLPQFAKVFNEVYRSYNSSQSPFILANIQMDTHMYDVNVSPDKRTILLHDQGHMLEKLKEALSELFANQDYTVPVAKLWSTKKTPGSSLHIDAPGIPLKSPPLAGKGSEKLHSFATLAKTETETPSRRTSMLRNQTDTSTQKDKDDDDNGNEGSALKAKSISASLAIFSANAPKSLAQPKLDQFVSGGSSKDNTPATKIKIAATAEILKEQEDVEMEDAGEEKSEPVEAKRERQDSATRRSMAFTEPTFGPTEDEEDDSLFVRDTSPPSERRPRQQDLVEEGIDEDISDEIINSIGRRKQLDMIPRVLINGRYHRPSDIATISIGSSTVTKVIGRSAGSKNAPAGISVGNSLGRSSSLPQRSKSKPSFGGRLAEMFALQGGKKQQDSDEEEGEDEDEEVEEEGDEDIEADQEPTLNEATRMLERRAAAQTNKLPVFKPLTRTASRKRVAESDPESGDDVDTRLVEDLPLLDKDGDIELSNATEAVMPTSKANLEDTPRLQTRIAVPADVDTPMKATMVAAPRFEKHATVNLVQIIKTSEDSIISRINALQKALSFVPTDTSNKHSDDTKPDDPTAPNAEEKLSLTISKGDFNRMKIVGQFNLGFILAVRPGTIANDTDDSDHQNNEGRNDEIFIIDQHATDEKYNFERLQATTIMQSQRLVNPKSLELTALEEEIVIENRAALEANGFDVAVDMSGDIPVGSRCQLLALPLSKETTFTLSDLEELISLLGDNQSSLSSNGDAALSSFATPSASFGEAAKKLTAIPRPSKVRKMFAMRACRSSVMIGRALAQGKMETLVRHMGELDKPWNCPHGRPTMRHLYGLAGWEGRGWGKDCYDGEAGRISWGKYTVENE